MQSFRLTLANKGTVQGAHSIPSQPSLPLDHRPLIVALHGGCYDHQYFDALPKYSASVLSEALGVPFVAIDRPSYGGTSSVLPIPSGSDFTRETAIRLHHFILPKIWAEFGVSHGCTCIVLLCHSLGVMSGTVVTSLHGQDESPLYPLGGLITSGLGDKRPPAPTGSLPPYTPVGTDHALCPLESKDAVMFKPGTYAPEMLGQSERLNVPIPVAEFGALEDWMLVWKEKWAPLVKPPVMFSLVENDPFFASTQEDLDRCVRAFTNSSRVDGSLTRGAPHCVELSYWARGWYARCFGFALECAANFAVTHPSS